MVAEKQVISVEEKVRGKGKNCLVEALDVRIKMQNIWSLSYRIPSSKTPFETKR